MSGFMLGVTDSEMNQTDTLLLISSLENYHLSRESDPTGEQTCKGGCGERLEGYAGSDLLQLIGDDGASQV